MRFTRSPVLSESNDNATFQEPTFLGKLVLLTPFCEFPHFDISTSVGVL